jgi:hypothetical protein
MKSPNKKITKKSTILAQVAPHKHLRGGLYIWPSLPRSAAGKVQKEELRHWSPLTTQSNGQDRLAPVFEALSVQVDQEQERHDEKEEDECHEPETFL